MRRLPELSRARDRFGLVYLLADTETNQRLTVRTFVNEPDPAFARSSTCGKGRTGWSARCGTCSASISRAIPTCGGSSCRRRRPAFRSARIIRCKGWASGTISRCLKRGEADMPLTLSELAADHVEDGMQPYLWTMNFGPQHPATHTTLRLVLKLDGERVADGDSRHRLSALGLREDRRTPRLQPVRHGHRPHELHLAHGQQRGLAHGGRKAAGHRNYAAVQLYPHDHVRADADQRPPALPGRDGHGHRRDDVLHVRLQREGADLRDLRGPVRRPLHAQLYPRRRRDGRHDAGWSWS